MKSAAAIERALHIEAADDPRLDDYRNVKDPAWLQRRDLFLAEGRAVVQRVLVCERFRPRSLLVTDAALRQLAPALQGKTLPVYVVARATLERVAGARFHQGCIAAVERPSEPSLEGLIAEEQRRWLVLENVSDPDNVGGLFRTARAFGVDAIALGPGCGHPLYRKATRTSMGATLVLPFARVQKWPADLERLRERGFVRVALTPRSDALDIADFVPPVRCALLVGNEGQGLSDAALAACDRRVRIPMMADVDSLNVATAVGIVLHRLAATHARQ